MKEEKNNYKVLVFGAGVLGSLYGAKLQEGGCDVTIVARGQRYKDLKEHGIIIEYFDTGERTTTKVKVLDSMPPDDYYDFCLVPVQKIQFDSALKALAFNKKIPAFLFMVNNTEGPQALIDVLGKERVILGFANAGGERDGHLVRLMIANGKAITMGELDGRVSERLQQSASIFKAADSPVDFSRNAVYFRLQL